MTTGAMTAMPAACRSDHVTHSARPFDQAASPARRQLAYPDGCAQHDAGRNAHAEFDDARPVLNALQPLHQTFVR